MTAGPVPGSNGNTPGVQAPANATNIGWDAENRLISATVNSITYNYEYDHLSRLVVRKVGTAISRRYIHDGWNRIAEYESSATTPYNTYTWGLDLSGSMQGAGGVGGLLAASEHSGTVQNPVRTPYYPTYDGNGNISEYLDFSGAAAVHYEYDPFGTVTRLTGSNSTRFQFRFSTKPRDPDTGLYYYGYRFYDPLTGRWPSRDPLAEYSDQHGRVRAELGTKLYGFVGNSPLNRVDPFGLVEMPDDLDSSNLSWNEIKKQLPGVPCKNPRSKGECCSKARAYFFANPANRGSPSGASVCCDGRLVACNWGENMSLAGYDGPNERLEDFIKKLVGECIVEHELLHVERTENYAKKYPNVACPCDCGILLSQTPTEETDGQECAAHGLSVKCFRKAQKKCAELSDKREAWICADIMSLKVDNSVQYRNQYCQKVLDSLPRIRVPIYK
jgi:RHS repeat-associated protein